MMSKRKNFDDRKGEFTFIWAGPASIGMDGFTKTDLARCVEDFGLYAIFECVFRVFFQTRKENAICIRPFIQIRRCLITYTIK